jgi:hypothetical protein
MVMGNSSCCVVHHHGTHYNTWAHRRRYTQIELKDGNAAISTVILEAPEDDRCRSKHVVRH